MITQKLFLALGVAVFFVGSSCAMDMPSKRCHKKTSSIAYHDLFGTPIKSPILDYVPESSALDKVDQPQEQEIHSAAPSVVDDKSASVVRRSEPVLIKKKESE